MASSSSTPRASASPERRQRRLTPTTPLLTPSASASHALTPVRARPQAMQTTSLSAPARTRTLPFSPLPTQQAARRSRQSLEAILVARTLKEGFARLKALADDSRSSSASPGNSRLAARRPLRTLSATLSVQSSRQAGSLLARHHSAVVGLGPRGAQRFEEGGGVEEAAEAMLFMRAQASARARGLSDDPPPPLPPPRAHEPGHMPGVGHSTGRERDAYETEDDAVLPPPKRKRPDGSDIPGPPLALPRVAELLSQPPSSGRASPAYDRHR
ncbi:hypothetical protein LPJ53_000473 [Coemansia erecta]|uniref:Uncharacterized protein n=1 Tax=Coemansia erecta TaxID=147472 RepID=A0A9W7Y1V8_9FUNG|nr:hypothetical protein LPJ53_000473 [Coemansia erecta]